MKLSLIYLINAKKYNISKDNKAPYPSVFDTPRSNKVQTNQQKKKKAQTSERNKHKCLPSHHFQLVVTCKQKSWLYITYCIALFQEKKKICIQ